MFTGIIQAIGKINQVTPTGDDIKLDIHTGDLDLSDTLIGDSIAVNGVCLTLVALGQHQFTAHVSQATLSCTVGLDAIGPINLEPALRYSDRLGGHLVSGHVDGVGQVVRFEAVGDCWQLAIRAPHAIAGFIAVKGSITVDGVSLTVNHVEKDTFTVNLIPHTLAHTTLQYLGIGKRVNLEVDLIARYVARMAEWQNQHDGDKA